MLTEQEKWNAIIKCDKNYDDKFLYGVKTSGVFCKPSCKSKEPKRINVKFFDNIEDAYAYGLRPCKRCRPDLVRFNPVEDLVKKAKDIFDAHYDNGEQLGIELEQIGISKNYLIELFRKHYDVTPAKYINHLRIEKALKLLSNSDIDIISIALLSGFGSLSAFYESFKKQTGMTPKEYKKIKSSSNTG